MYKQLLWIFVGRELIRPKALSDAIHWRYLRYHYDQGTIVGVEALNDSGRR